MMDQALNGYSVLDLTTTIAGAFGTMFMADLGATVVKAERPDGDPMRQNDALFTAYNRNKKSITVDLEDASELEKLKSILGNFDVMIDDLPEEIMKKYGLDDASIREACPGLVTVSISNYGKGNSYSARPAFEETLQAESGLSFSIMDLGKGDPYTIDIPVVEATSAYYAVAPLLAALHEKNKTGKGQHVEINKYFAATSMLHFNLMYYKYMDILYAGQVTGAPAGFARTKDGIVLLMSEREPMWTRTLNLIEDPILHDPKFSDPAVRKANADLLMERIEAWLAQYTSREVDVLFTKAGIPIGFVRNIDELAEDPHVHARDSIVEIEVEGQGKMPFFANPVRLADSPAKYERAPRLGENNAEYLEGGAK